VSCVKLITVPRPVAAVIASLSPFFGGRPRVTIHPANRQYGSCTLQAGGALSYIVRWIPESLYYQSGTGEYLNNSEPIGSIAGCLTNNA
jgi:hypothetical protein